MADLVVETQYGRVQGVQENGISVWRGIPFAHSTEGQWRFDLPQPPDAWTGVREATAFGPVAPQPVSPMIIESQMPASEDCLSLNIWSPAADNNRRPVLVWIYGGAFVVGGSPNPLYDGTRFAANGDVVVVTLNYRLGVLGFLHLADLPGGEEFVGSGNLGLFDIIEGLKWVKNNIAAFGGDPNRVTIFGESAGAHAIGVLLAMPAAQNLFQQAILESGSGNAVLSRETATQVASDLLQAVGLDTQRPLDPKVLAEIPLGEWQTAATKIGGDQSGPFKRVFYPVLDNQTLPQHPFTQIANGSARNVRTLVGSNHDEMNLFVYANPEWSKLDEASLKQRCEEMAGEAIWNQVSAFYAESAQPNESPVQKWIRFLTALRYRIPAITLAEKQVEVGAPVWMYRFDWPSPIMNGLLGACHGLEIPFVWNNLDKPGLGAMVGDGPGLQNLADTLHRAWIAFARNGTPDWPAYTDDQHTTMIFNEVSQLQNDPDGDERKIWAGLL